MKRIPMPKQCVLTFFSNLFSRSEVYKVVGPSRAKPREFERKINLYIYIYIVEDFCSVAW